MGAVIQRFVDLLEVRQLVHPNLKCVLINLFWMGGCRHFKESPTVFYTSLIKDTCLAFVQAAST